MRIIGEFGSFRLVVDVNNFTYQKVVELNEKIADIRREESIFAKYPLSEGEDRAAWRTRVEPLIEEDMIRKEGEDVSTHLRRMLSLKVDTFELAPKILAAVCDTMGLKNPGEDELGQASWLELKGFIHQILSSCDIPCEDFYVPDVKA